MIQSYHLSKKVFKLFIKSKAGREQAQESFEKLKIKLPETDYFINFIKNSERGVTR